MIYWGMCSVPFNVSGMTVIRERCLDYRFDSGVTTVPAYKENLVRAKHDFSNGIEVVFCPFTEWNPARISEVVDLDQLEKRGVERTAYMMIEALDEADVPLISRGREGFCQRGHTGILPEAPGRRVVAGHSRGGRG